MEPMIASNFDEDLIEEFTHGECWSLAAALNRSTGLPFIAIYGEHECQHVAIQLPNEQVLDVYGVWDESDWVTYWYEELEDEWDVRIEDLTLEDNDRMVALASTTWDKDMCCDGQSVQDVADALIFMLHLDMV